MKKVIKVSVFFLFIFACLVAPQLSLFAQVVDSTGAGGPEVVDSIFGITLPGLLKTVFISLMIVLPAVQVVLKRIPTDFSVKIGGVLGKILDILTFFQKDKTARK